MLWPLAALALLSLSAPAGELGALAGPQPEPLRAPHLPRPLDEYVFRNWGIVPPERLAETVGARVEDVRALAEALGLGRPPTISAEAWRRSYLTVIRRNWHLLPYDQLLQLLGWDEAKLAFVLKEDDFLWIKLGSLKPRCARLQFEPIPDALRPRYDTIRTTVVDALGPNGLAGFRRRFAFLDELAAAAQAKRRIAGGLQEKEVSLEKGWRIALPGGAGGVARSAAERFAVFLKDVFGAEAPAIDGAIGGAIGGDAAAAPPPPDGGGRIGLAVLPDGFKSAESHELLVEPGLIRITARDEEGLLRGLDRLKDRMLERGGPFFLPGSERRETRIGLRFLYSYFALYGDPLLEPELDPYPDAYLEKLSRRGVNGVWLQAILQNLAPEPAKGEPASGAAAFAGFGAGSARRLESLKLLVERARRYGIGVYLYLNEPRAMPAAYFASHPDLAGVEESGMRALCTGRPEVREHISATLAHVFRSVPNLAGVFTITMSENLTSCWSHGRGKACPRCGARPGAEVVAEVNRAVHEGVRRSSSGARVIAWDWGWPDDWTEPILAALPTDVALMSVSEWSLPLRRGGVESAVGEYSLSAVGPGPRANRAWEIARRQGRPAFAKIQANTSWELSAVPYLPVAPLVADHLKKLREAGVEGLMLGWTLGGYPSPNLETAAEYYFGEPPDQNQAVLKVARRRFGKAAGAVASAWRAFADAFLHFPFHAGLVYNAPLQLGPANLLYPRETGYRATMVGLPYDDLESWRAVYPAEVMVEQLRLVSQGWEKGLPQLRDDPGLDPAAAVELAAERRVSRAARLHFRSVAAQARFVLERRALEKETDRREAVRRLDRLRGILLQEIGNARELLGLLRDDSRLGFEASNQYYYLPGDLAEKIINCRWLIEEWIAPEKKRRQESP